jgi:hypothetical protein
VATLFFPKRWPSGWPIAYSAKAATCRSGVREKIVQGDYLVCAMNAITLRKIPSRPPGRSIRPAVIEPVSRVYFAGAYLRQQQLGYGGRQPLCHVCGARHP